MEVPNPTLNSISEKVDALWSARLTSIRTNNKELAPLVYSAWKLLVAGHRGRPQAGAESFSSWLKERKIPRSTGNDILNRERVRLGELNVRTVQFSGSTATGELDLPPDDAQEATVEAQNSLVVASVPSGDAVASPLTRKPQIVLTPAELKAKREDLERQLREQVGDVAAQRIIDQAVVDHITSTLFTTPRRKTNRKQQAGNRELANAA